MKKLNKKGVALIVSVATTVIFMMLVVTVVVISMSTYKKSSQIHDRAMALNLAEAGINETFYQMNYRYYNETVASGATYPADFQYLNFSYLPALPATNYLWQASQPSPNLFGLSSSNGYIVQFFARGTDPDELRSTGIYNGKRRLISIKIRGTNAGGAALNFPTHGIAEAFNKHALYANRIIVGDVSGTTCQVTGNIAATSCTYVNALDHLSGDSSLVILPAALYTDVPQLTIPLSDADIGLTFPGPFDEYYENGNRVNADGSPHASGEIFNINYAGIGFYNGIDTYNFNGSGVITNSIQILSAAGHIVFNPASSIDIQKAISARDIKITGGTVNLTLIGQLLGIGGNITISGGTLAFDNANNILSDGSVFVTGGTIEGSLQVRGASGIVISGSPTFNNPNNKASIMKYGSVNSLNITGTPSFNLSQFTNNQIAIVIYYSSTAEAGGITLNVNNGILGNNNLFSSNWNGATIIAISEANLSRVNVYGNGIVYGLIYNYGNISGIPVTNTVANTHINIQTNGRVEGTLVTNGTTYLQAGTLKYRGDFFMRTDTAFVNVYKGFNGNINTPRRVYLPMPGSWREE